LNMHKYGLKKDKPDLRDHIFYSTKFKTTLPTHVDLRAGCSPIVAQGNLGSCTANAIASGLREYQLKKVNKWVALSRLFLYWQERKLEGDIADDNGAQIRDGMKALHQIGVCPEVDWPYDITTFANTPTYKDNTDAAVYKISEYHRISSLDLLKAALAEGMPVVIGITVYTSFESANAISTGIVPVPNLQTEQILGGHAICCIGYDDAKSANGQTGYVIFRNSWGTSYGEQGYGYLPYAFWAQNLVSDCWTSKD